MYENYKKKNYLWNGKLKSIRKLLPALIDRIDYTLHFGSMNFLDEGHQHHIYLLIEVMPSSDIIKLLTSLEWNEVLYDKKRCLEQFSNKTGITVGEMVLQWCREFERQKYKGKIYLRHSYIKVQTFFKVK